jgi:hypothetical protein
MPDGGFVAGTVDELSASVVEPVGLVLGVEAPCMVEKDLYLCEGQGDGVFVLFSVV